jgi:catechol 2,3-dioxygenase-like lactoylglutathione lyase family enzyme
MSFRSTIARNVGALQPEYVRREPAGRDAVFRFSVPVLRVRDVAATVSWYRRHLGFHSEAFPEQGSHEFAILERDGVQLLVRREYGEPRQRDAAHSGWDLYIWVDGVDLARLQASIALSGEVVRPLSPMGSSMAEFEVRDPDGYVLCIGGPTRATLAASAPSIPPA